MSYDFPDGPDWNPEPPDEHRPLAAEGDCPDCGTGTIVSHVGCDRCGLTWDDLVAADAWWRQQAATM